MNRLTNICKIYEIVVVPFPFTDQAETKNRPALILSSELFNAKNGKSIMAMITSNTGKELWPNDVPIKHIQTAGLKEKSLVRFKIFTIDHRLIRTRIGSLHDEDVKAIKMRLRDILEF